MIRFGRTVLGVSCVVAMFAACSGRSERSGGGSDRKSGGAGGAGGTSGSGAADPTGGSAGATACVRGETRACLGPGRCQGAQACLPDGRGWETCDCGSGGSGGTAGSSVGGAGDGGGGGQPDPFGMCPEPPLLVGTTCSFDASCEALDCGSATSLHDSYGCLRETCRSSDDCPEGTRCLPAPVAGEIRDCWSSGCESCEETDDGCACTCFEDCSRRAVCVSDVEFPPEDDCPTEGLSCDAVREAIVNVEDYIAGGKPTFEDEPLAALESCRDTLLAAEPAACDFCEVWNGRDLEDLPQTVSAAVTEWSSSCGATTVGIARGCDFTAVWRFQNSGSPFKQYYLYDGDGVVGFYQLGVAADCARATERTGIQLACYDDISEFCDPTVRQLFFSGLTVTCETLELCEVCGNGDHPECESVQ